jgi:hypothetical protein
MSVHGVRDLLGRVRAQERAQRLRRGTQNAHGADAHNATIATLLSVLAQSSCYHWRDEDGRDAYAIVRLDRKSDAHDLCPAMYDAYYLRGGNEEGELCTPWACPDVWLERHAEHRAEPWALPRRLWALACADTAENGMHTQRPEVLPLRLWSLTYAADSVQELHPATAAPGPESPS